MKTGALISAAFTGPALLKNVKGADLKAIQDIGFLMGYAFQVKDDILDSTQDNGSKKNLSYYFQDSSQLEGFLIKIHQEIENKIAELDLRLKFSGGQSACLTQFLSWNLRREK